MLGYALMSSFIALIMVKQEARLRSATVKRVLSTSLLSVRGWVTSVAHCRPTVSSTVAELIDDEDDFDEDFVEDDDLQVGDEDFDEFGEDPDR